MTESTPPCFNAETLEEEVVDEEGVVAVCLEVWSTVVVV